MMLKQNKNINKKNSPEVSPSKGNLPDYISKNAMHNWKLRLKPHLMSISLA
jgi:hypothetical protein